MGRRLLRLIDPESDEGLRLFAAGSVDLIGPDGEQLGRLRPTEAYLRLKQRLERRLAEPDADIDPSALQDGLDRLRSWSERIGRA